MSSIVFPLIHFICPEKIQLKMINELGDFVTYVFLNNSLWIFFNDQRIGFFGYLCRKEHRQRTKKFGFDNLGRHTIS
jgi:hypothetical protein